MLIPNAKIGSQLRIFILYILIGYSFLYWNDWIHGTHSFTVLRMECLNRAIQSGVQAESKTKVSPDQNL
jgi:hypothetical protein